MEPGTDVRTTDLTDLTTLRRRRAELRESINALEVALAAPASGRAVIWGERVHEALRDLDDDFREHIELNEGPDGLHQMILAGDLRLANAVAALGAEHAPIAADIAALIEATEPPVTPPDVDSVRDGAVRLLGRLVRHRQRGADLIYEAFETDIGGGD